MSRYGNYLVKQRTFEVRYLIIMPDRRRNKANCFEMENIHLYLLVSSWESNSTSSPYIHENMYCVVFIDPLKVAILVLLSHMLILYILLSFFSTFSPLAFKALSSFI